MEYTTAVQIRNAIENKKVTAIEVLEHYLDIIAQKDKEIGAFLEVFEDDARAQAKKIDEMVASGESLPRMAGVPIAVKDNILVKGHIASAGSKILENHVATYDATAVANLKEAGAVIIGRTNMDEFAMGSSTETSFWQVTKNPVDTTKVPGGSSGGSVAAVAAGMVPVALGSSTGGSIQQPASLCGVYGMKPTYGFVSRYGLIALGSSLDQIGAITNDAKDMALVLEVIEGIDEHDATSVDIPEVVTHELLQDNFEGMTFGVPKEYFVDEMDADVKKLVEEAIEKIKSAGGTIKEVSLPLTEYALPAYYIIQPAEASSNLGRFDGMRYGTRAQSDKLKESYLMSRGGGFGKEVKRRIMIGTYVLSAGYYDAYYKKALQIRQMISKDFERVFEEVDVLVGPTSPVVAWGLGDKFDDPIAMYLADIFTVSVNIAGISSISVPCGLAKGLPVGLQFLAGAGQDGKILRAAAAFEALTK
ncbi:Asp-tRNA(Asn)/Glu-tRNA(Gln) amidotransferase subunit GatA [Candidatus Uhrbacteria bacterium]|jgi:aspartyl-tRNA(Asn)/glutamyl-tRNA(Gln) amidotransferase subunit A|nr:Asp-tRNA(Asn)/Glu-tRNA(Gln) amidotransferase subunit GatA [Candidatus Uhrbacteria bacterium]MBT7717302.1 Asp-tRNA(Asn)/Glu-tRNA(Gln) amidotransferase subunit GatA [Candidatus Uhrbacteria bacterium]